MKNITKIIHIKIMEIFMVIAFVIGSYFIWNSLNKSELFELLENNHLPTSYAYIEVLTENQYNMYPMQDEEAMNNLLPNSIQMINNTYFNTEYALGIKVKKTSTLDYQNLKISIQNKASYLKDYYVAEDNLFYYFKLEEGSLQAKTIKYDIKLWLDIEANKETSGTSFEYEFINLKNIEM